MWLTRAMSMTNFAVASSALAFQVFVLYPWHEDLQADFNKLRQEHKESLDAVKEDVEGLTRGRMGTLDAVKKAQDANKK
ncbi:hypothetical protein ACRALDRAFT_1060682 [Sodiomyces alcalophilus JCM 7366]|uniref:uncharacterized protein n=1 Tax=Sodiomyces alcalophilus JCM 7366 TaxID=591952 RepID=UPI0039B62A99